MIYACLCLKVVVLFCYSRATRFIDAIDFILSANLRDDVGFQTSIVFSESHGPSEACNSL